MNEQPTLDTKLGRLKRIVCSFTLLIKPQERLRGGEREAQALHIQKASEAVPLRYSVHQGHRLCSSKVRALCVPPTQLYSHFPTLSQQILLFAGPRRLLQDYMDEAAQNWRSRRYLCHLWRWLSSWKRVLFLVLLQTTNASEIDLLLTVLLSSRHSCV